MTIIDAFMQHIETLRKDQQTRCERCHRAKIAMRAGLPCPYRGTFRDRCDFYTANVARVSGATEAGFPADGASAEPALLDGAAPDGNAGPRPRHTGRAQRPASIPDQTRPASSEAVGSVGGKNHGS